MAPKRNLNDLGCLNPKPKAKDRSQIAKSAGRRGKSGERFWAEKLTQYSGSNWIRVPNSGAYTGGQNRDRLKVLTKVQGYLQLGDLIPPEDLKFRFIIESKAYSSDVDFHNMLNPCLSKTIIGWMQELEYDTESAISVMGLKEPLSFLCVKLIRKGNWVVFNSGMIHKILGGCTLPTPYLTFVHEPKAILKENGWDDIFYLMDFENFIKYNKELLFIKIDEEI